MNIQFNTLKIKNFQSIGAADIELKNRGIVTIIGINNYEHNAKSNGSGKTSIPSSLFWCLYGKTPEGINNPTNRYSGDKCQVSTEFTVDNNVYMIERSVNGSSQSVSLYINGNLQSARNKSDSDKIIKEDILKMSPDIFLSLIYLSQGFNSRLSALTPAARKDRLEQLTSTAESIDIFSKRISNGKSDLTDKCNKLQMEISKRNGSISTYEKMISDYEQRLLKDKDTITTFEYKGVIYSQSNVSELQTKLNKLRSELDDVMKHKLDSSKAVSDIMSKIRNNENEINRNNTRIKELNSHIDHVKNGSICPTCKQHIDQNNKEKLLDKYNNELSVITNRNSDIQNILDEYRNKLSTSKDCLSDYENLENSLRSQAEEVSYILKHIPPKNELDIEQINLDITNYKHKISEIKEEVESLNSEYIEYDNLLSVVSHCQQLVTKPFRAYLLKSTVDFLNNRLKEYSNYLFSNESDVIQLTTDSQKLDILLGECDYSTLSGGEKRRVDLAVMLAQRDLATELAGMTSNIIILDEIMESMDETATQTTLELLENQSQTADSLESMFLISHNDYAIPVDSRIVVEKGVDRISRVIQY